MARPTKRGRPANLPELFVPRCIVKGCPWPQFATGGGLCVHHLRTDADPMWFLRVPNVSAYPVRTGR